MEEDHTPCFVMEENDDDHGGHEHIFSLNVRRIMTWTKVMLFVFLSLFNRRIAVKETQFSI